MKLFENYASGIERILSENYTSVDRSTIKSSKPSDILLKAMGKDTEMFKKSIELQGQIDGDKALLNIDREGLTKLFGSNASGFEDIVIGSHPDFADLDYNGYLNHHCVSMFVDIKGSTRLALKEDLKKVRLIKDSLLTLCIHVANFFGGHIHRLQGDAVFVQFVRKGAYKNDAIINSLNAASVLCQFVEQDLKDVFEKKGLSPIKIRIGIDYGNDEDVLWSHYGVPSCAELTTTSLHTDLAAKLQSKAPSNGIVIGANIVKELDLPEEFVKHVYKTVDDKQVVETYVINGFNYKQYIFKWKTYLLSFDFIKKSSNGITLDIEEKDFRITCKVSDEGKDNWTPYYQNSYSIPKKMSIAFTITFKGLPYYRQGNETIEWVIHNRGDEAQLEQKVEIRNINETECVTNAAYLGHHYISCKIKRNFGSNITVTFPVYVQ
ncbi:nucleotide-binding domain-containing protein [Sphingobacterium paludis]|uniref:Class 3 adenylate cyclase n=1 Tax=Sphingobacterium paludis TaxID=1476465 RepID=A0A4R7D488_9SPHI|nr:hypothetical protein [Sphingobacterium paludis]TDS14951.1 class 3 adenylate cyclase [Sphingobacterium paludis]